MENQAWDTPWKIWNGLGSALQYPYCRLIFYINRIPWGSGWRFYGIPIVQKHRQSFMRFGSRFNLRSAPRSNPLGANHPVILCTWLPGAILEIGDNFGMTGGALVAAEKIMIGNNVAIGANSTILDTDFHPLNPELRRHFPQSALTAPIIIGDDVFIGMNSLILKGVTIGGSSVIGAGSVVTKNVPPRVIVAGNPAQIVREI
jgi:acetyltransferase-like isoleucine patch superfamily enzyme